jgi:hypothetical protein
VQVVTKEEERCERGPSVGNRLGRDKLRYQKSESRYEPVFLDGDEESCIWEGPFMMLGDCHFCGDELLDESGVVSSE